MIRLSTKISIIAAILVILVALSSIFVTAQTPAPSPTPGGTPTVTVTPIPSPGQNTPVIGSYTVEVQRINDDNTMADVMISLSLENFDISTETPAPGTGGTPQGLVKFCMDQITAIPMPTASPGMSPSPVPSPTILASPSAPLMTVTPTPFPAGLCVLSTDDSFTFRGVPVGVHSFMAELVQADGAFLSPRIFVHITMMVIPPP